METVTAYIGLGSNIGDREGHIGRAVALLNGYDVTVRRQAPVYRTEPRGRTAQAEFLNTVVQVETTETPVALLGTVKRVEKQFAERTGGHWGPREMDADILLYGRLACRTGELAVPHPRLHERKFVLVPLADIAGDVIHPVFKRTIKALLEVTSDTGTVIPVSERSIDAVYCH